MVYVEILLQIGRLELWQLLKDVAKYLKKISLVLFHAPLDIDSEKTP